MTKVLLKIRRRQSHSISTRYQSLSNLPVFWLPMIVKSMLRVLRGIRGVSLMIISEIQKEILKGRL